MKGIRVARRAPAGVLHRKCACGGNAGRSGQCEACAKKQPLQRRATGDAVSSVPPIVHETLRSPGHPLDSGTRALIEPRLGHDFGHVRVHADARAAESASAVNAAAYTVGSDIVFGAGRYAPGSSEGQMLLAHELTHVVQQGSSPGPQSGMKVGRTDDMYEHQADEVAAQVTAGDTGDRANALPGAHRSSAGALLQRQIAEPATDGATGPTAPTPAAPTVSAGQVVNVEVRDGSGKVTEFSHEYPVDLAGNIEFPTAGTVAAAGKTLVQLRQAIHNAFAGGVFVSPTVNVSLSSKTVSYSDVIRIGATLQIRVLDGVGAVDPSSGAYTVDTAGKIHIPFLGDLSVAGMTMAALENQIEGGIRNAFITNAVVNVTSTVLN